MSSSEVLRSGFLGALLTSRPDSVNSEVDSEERKPLPWVNFGGSLELAGAISTADVDSSDRSAHSTITEQAVLRIEPPRAEVCGLDKAPNKFIVLTKRSSWLSTAKSSFRQAPADRALARSSLSGTSGPALTKPRSGFFRLECSPTSDGGSEPLHIQGPQTQGLNESAEANPERIPSFSPYRRQSQAKSFSNGLRILSSCLKTV